MANDLFKFGDQWDTEQSLLRKLLNAFVAVVRGDAGLLVRGSVTSTVSGAVTVSGDVVASGTGYTSSAEKTRPADTNAYSANDVVANSTSAATVWTFADIGPAGGKILLDSIIMEIQVGSIPSGLSTFRLHLYDAQPTAINDNVAFDLPSGDRAKHLGFIETGTMLDFGSTIKAQRDGDDLVKQVKLANGSTTLYGILETVGAFTPTSGAVKKLTLHAIRVE